MAKKPASKSAAGSKSGAGKGMSADQLLQRLKPAAASIAANPGSPIKRVLSDLGVRGPIVLLSNQHVRVKRLVAWLREHLFDDSPESFSSYFGNDLNSAQSADHICGSLVSLSLFTKNQLLVIYEADKVKAGAQKAIQEALKRATDSTLLVLAAESVSNRVAFLNESASSGTVVELAELSGPALDRWIEKEVARVGIAAGIAPDAKELLIKCYGGDVSRLAPEIEKLSLLIVPGEMIERPLVEAISLRNPDVTSFELVRQLAAKNPLHAVGLANDLVLQGLHPLQVNAFLSRALRMLLANKERTGAALHPELSNPWFLRQLSASGSSFSTPGLKSAIERLTKLDFQLKDSGFPPPLALSIAMQEIAARRN